MSLWEVGKVLYSLRELLSQCQRDLSWSLSKLTAITNLGASPKELAMKSGQYDQ